MRKSQDVLGMYVQVLLNLVLLSENHIGKRDSRRVQMLAGSWRSHNPELGSHNRKNRREIHYTGNEGKIKLHPDFQPQDPFYNDQRSATLIKPALHTSPSFLLPRDQHPTHLYSTAQPINFAKRTTKRSMKERWRISMRYRGQDGNLAEASLKSHRKPKMMAAVHRWRRAEMAAIPTSEVTGEVKVSRAHGWVIKDEVEVKE